MRPRARDERVSKPKPSQHMMIFCCRLFPAVSGALRPYNLFGQIALGPLQRRVDGYYRNRSPDRLPPY